MYVVPGDIMTKGADFLAEAERLKEAEMGRVCLASLQATLLLHEWFVFPVFPPVCVLVSLTVKAFSGG